MNNNDRNASHHDVWDDEEEFDDWPPPDEFRGFKLAMLGIVLLILVGAGGWWAYQSLDPADYREDPYRERALEYLAEGDYRGAVTELTMVVQENPTDAEMHWLLGNAHLQLGEHAAAREHLKTAYDLGNYAQPLLLALAQASLLDGKYEDALLLTREWSDVASLQASAEWEVLRGRALFNLGRQKRAAEAFVQALKLDAGNMEAKRALARTGADTDLSGLAGPGIEAALSTGLDRPDTWLLKAELELSRGAYEQARASFEKALELGPDNVYALSGLARTLLATGQLDAAGEPVRILTQRFPSDPAGAYVRALYAQKNEDYQLALDTLQIVLRHNPNHALSLLMLGEVQLAMGKRKQALLNLGRFHRLAPDNPVGRKRLAIAYVENGQAERAVNLLKPLADQQPADPEIATILASAYAQLGKSSPQEPPPE